MANLSIKSSQQSSIQSVPRSKQPQCRL